MGLSASQSRLLSLTSRLSDLELKAQQISNSKVRLSDLSQETAKTYSEALNKQKMKVYTGIKTDGTANYKDATAYNLTTYSAISNLDKQRFIKNEAGQVLVTEKVKEAYDSSNGDLISFLQKMDCTSRTTPDTVALTGLISDIKTSQAYTKAPDGTGASALVIDDTPNGLDANNKPLDTNSAEAKLIEARDILQKNSNTLTTQINDATDNAIKAMYTALKAKTDSVIESLDIGIAWCSDTVIAVDQDLLKLIITGTAGNAAGDGALYRVLKGQGRSSLSDVASNNNLQTVKDSMEIDLGSGDAKYYTTLFAQISESGGCITPGDDNMNNSNWLTEQIKAGDIFLYEYDPNGGKEGTGAYVNTSWLTGDNSLQMQSDDNDMAKAEADYQTTMASIETKDKRFDLQLNQINTEHNAIQTEVDSVKKVIDKNIEKSFKIFDA